MEQNHPKVSVIIPIYGVEKYIERCAISLFEQTLENIEFIFVDDCTPDRSMEILHSIIEKYRPRLTEEKKTVIIERMPVNCGLAAVRRHGLQVATGDYVIHCDSDDWVDTDMYRAMYEKAVEDDADVVVCDFIKTDGSDTSKDIVHIGCNDTDKNTFINNMLTLKNSWALWNKMFKRTIYCGNIYFPKDAMGEDFATVFQLMLNCQKVAYINRNLYFYFENTSSITRSNDESKMIKRVYQAINNVQLVANVFEEKKLSEEYCSGLNYLKLNQKELLLPFLVDRDVYKYWHSTFPELKTQVIKMNIRWQVKFKYYLVLFGGYRVLNWVCRKSQKR